MSNLPVPVDEEFRGEGLEDFDQSDMTMPQLRVDHENGKLVDSLSNEQFDELTVVILGAVKQRIMWPPELSEAKSAPLCRSLNFDDGLPPDGAKFPWKASGFKQSDWIEGTSLPCEACKLKDWGSHPKLDTPWCSEQLTFAMLVPVGEGALSPALFTVQRSGLKNARAYYSSFGRTQSPFFTRYTKIGLTLAKRGTVNYAMPNYTMLDPTPRENWIGYRDTWRQIKSFVQTPRETSVEEPTATGARAQSAGDDDDIDFEEI